MRSRPDDALAAIDPRRNAVVHAAAGTGKTWLLVSRVVRLLLAGARPSSVLAITFTRKAAAEMRSRVGERLFDLCRASDAQLHTELEAIGVAADADVCARARGLYEQLLVAPHELRATTFHAFCQELLARFAFDAGVPPSFEVAEQTAEIEASAWRALDRDLARGDGELTDAMDRLLQDLGGLDNTHQALRAFLDRRSDWWAYTEEETDPIAFAAARLRQTLDIDPDVDALESFAHDANVRAQVQALTAGIARDTPPSLAALHAGLEQALAAPDAAGFYRSLHEALYTKEGNPRAFRVPKEFAGMLGTDAVDVLTRRRQSLLDAVAQTTDHCKRRATWQRTRDWCLAGARLLHHFQEEKRAQAVLDFADLEWFAYRMLTRSRHAEWVQYKLDQRIDHLLVDEFQDTNPTQWRLLLPLLAEMAAGSDDRRRSVFLVGDEKQSIYRFRRADPALFAHAREWLAQHTGAGVHDQHVSWRSSPAVVHFVNLVFDPPPADTPTDGDHTLQGFRTHETYRHDLWGHAELLPLILRDPKETTASDFRNPLVEPRSTEEDKRREREGDLLAEKIRTLIGRPIYRRREIRPLGYGDIMILLRSRTHATAYEAALRRAGIPYVGAGRGMFLECLEVRDILDLLRLLIAPWDDVALAAVLRSPIFAATDDELLALAASDENATTWYDRLRALGHDENPKSTLARAARLLAAWRGLADRIPVHDLLDRIYFEADVPPRYAAAAPMHLRPRIAANLTRLLDLALEADGGRFPSLARFLTRLETLTGEDSEAFDAGTERAADQVRIMTIHAAKGLESPVVFLADAARDIHTGERGADALIEWPIDRARPNHFLLLARKTDVDSRTSEIVKRRAAAAFQEESNLLYVALTRAQQLLFVSGCESGRRRGDVAGRAGDANRGWYGHVERRLDTARADGRAAELGARLQIATDPSSAEPINIYGTVSHGLPPALPVAPASADTAVSVDPSLTRPFDTSRETAPAEETDERDEPLDVDPTTLPAAKRRGVVIHRILERLSIDGAGREHAKRQVWCEFAPYVDDEQLTEYWDEACATIDAPDLRRVFDSDQYKEARNEVAVLYRADDREVTGVIDRLVIRDDGLTVIDYKTHRVNTQEIPTLVRHYTPQLQRYADGLRRLWPEKPIEMILVFTSIQRAVPVQD